jgi:predicted permease
MQFAVPDSPGDAVIAGRCLYLDGQQAAIVSTGCFFFLDHGQTAPGGDNVAVNDVDLFFSDTFQQPPMIAALIALVS